MTSVSDAIDEALCRHLHGAQPAAGPWTQTVDCSLTHWWAALKVPSVGVTLQRVEAGEVHTDPEGRVSMEVKAYDENGEEYLFVLGAVDHSRRAGT